MTLATRSTEQTADRIEILKQQREDLEEEVKQLRAAVQVYTEVVRRLAQSAGSVFTPRAA